MSRPKKVKNGEYYKAFPSALRCLMDERGTTQQVLADHLQKSRQAVSCYCDGTSSPDWETIVKIASFFSVSADWLLGMSSVQSPDTDLQAVVEYTGIPEDAIQAFQKCAEMKHLLSTEQPHAQIRKAVEDGAVKANKELNESDIENLYNSIAQQYACIFDMIVGFMRYSSPDSQQWLYLRDMATAHFNFVSLQKECSAIPEQYGNPERVELDYALFRCQQSYIEYCKQLAKGK